MGIAEVFTLTSIFVGFIFFIAGAFVLFVRRTPAVAFLEVALLVGSFITIYSLFPRTEPIFNYMNGFTLGSFALIISTFMYPLARPKSRENIRWMLMVSSIAVASYFASGFVSSINVVFPGGKYPEATASGIDALFVLGSFNLFTAGIEFANLSRDKIFTKSRKK